MKSFRFQNLVMMSTTARAGRVIQFHPEVTVIRGANDTGKSSIIKALYHTFGATPPSIHHRWRALGVVSMVRFTCDGEDFRVLRSGDRITVFGADDQPLMSETRITSGVAPAFAELFGFNLKLQGRGGPGQATPSFMFLPFYIDQDGGWEKSWSSFANLNQFTNWKKDLVEYHTGIRPDRFYTLRDELNVYLERSKAHQQRRDVLIGIRDHLRERTPPAAFSINIDEYQAEIERLLTACNALGLREENLKHDLTRIYNERASAELQLSIVRSAARELGLDYRFADSLGDEVECPMCGTVHTNSFAERFEIARDEVRCSELEAELISQIQTCDQRLASVRHQQGLVSGEIERIQEALSLKQGDVTLGQLIQQQGQRDATLVIDEELTAVRATIRDLTETIGEFEREMARLDNPNVRRQVEQRYHDRMRSFLAALGVTSVLPTQYRRLDQQIQETGSVRPRVLLAYFFSILHTMVSNQQALMWPIVIDSPRQQDQDTANWRRVLGFMKDSRPTDSQLVLGLVDDEGVDFGGHVEELRNPRSALSEEQYREAQGEVLRYLNQVPQDGLFNVQRRS